MKRKGVEFSLMQAGPGLWKWQFQIGETVTTGKTHSNLKGLAAHRAQQRIDRELRKPRESYAVGESTVAARGLSFPNWLIINFFGNVSCIDHRLREPEEHAGSIAAPPSASIGDRECLGARLILRGQNHAFTSA